MLLATKPLIYGKSFSKTLASRAIKEIIKFLVSCLGIVQAGYSASYYRLRWFK